MPIRLPWISVPLTLGPFSLGLSDGFDLEKVRRLAAQRLAPVAQAFKTDTFHAVGGAWRVVSNDFTRSTR